MKKKQYEFRQQLQYQSLDVPRRHLRQLDVKQQLSTSLELRAAPQPDIRKLATSLELHNQKHQKNQNYNHNDHRIRLKPLPLPLPLPQQQQCDYIMKYALRSKKGSHIINQDVFFSCLNQGPQQDINVFVVGDGHGKYGHLVSGWLKENFKIKLIELIESKLNVKWIKQLFESLSKDLLQNSNVDCSQSGSTLIGLFIQGPQLICANVGDSRCICCRKSGFIQLSRDHKPDVKEEMERIQRNKGRVAPLRHKDGQVESVMRVWLAKENTPGLAMSRSFGDTIGRLVGVISEASMIEHRLEEQDRVVVIGSDGLWDQIDNGEVQRLVMEYYEKNDLEGCCKQLFDTLQSRWQKSSDDITFGLIFIYYFKYQ